MSHILRLLKEGFTRRAIEFCRSNAPHLLRAVTERRRSREIHRFWQEGGGYDRNLHDWAAIQRALEYIEWNPARRGLVDEPTDWHWSSAQARNGETDVPLTIDAVEIEDSL